MPASYLGSGPTLSLHTGAEYICVLWMLCGAGVPARDCPQIGPKEKTFNLSSTESLTEQKPFALSDINLPIPDPQALPTLP